jgi:hypothetical protein
MRKDEMGVRTASMEEMKNRFKIVVEIPQGKSPLGMYGLDLWVLLKWMLEKCAKVSNGGIL